MNIPNEFVVKSTVNNIHQMVISKLILHSLKSVLHKFSNYNLKYADIIYRHINLALLGNFCHDPILSLNRNFGNMRRFDPVKYFSAILMMKFTCRHINYFN